MRECLAEGDAVLSARPQEIDEAAYARLFRDTGTLRMQSMEQQVDTAYAFANGVFPRSPR